MSTTFQQVIAIIIILILIIAAFYEPKSKISRQVKTNLKKYRKPY